MTEHSYPAKDFVFHEGDPPLGAYTLLEGQVEILKHAEHGEVQLAVLNAGSVFGEMSLIEGAPRSASARCMTPCRIDMLSADEFHHLMDQVPDALRPILRAMINRLNTMNKRVASKERATVLPDVAINHVIILGRGVLEGIVGPIEIETANMPFSIGGYAEGTDRPQQNLDIVCKEQPALVSRNHLQFELQERSVYLVDHGSRFGTIVNGMAIGRGKPEFKAPLIPGENLVLLGGHSSPYQLHLECS